MNQCFAALRRRISRGEGGFTVTELAAAFAILLIALTALARTATVGFTDAAFARQRQAGNQFANQLLEQVRALPYDTLKKGLSPTDLSGDPNIVTCSGVRYFRTTCPAPATAERIVTTGTVALPNATPLVPHRGTAGPPTYPTTYSWGVYVTEAKDVPSKGAYRVTAIVTWSAGARSGARRSVEAQTLIYSPEGCADTSTHPFAAPCQPFLSNTGTVGGGGWDTTGTLSGVSFDSVSGSLLSASSDIRVEQIGRVEGNVTMPEVARSVAGVETVVGGGAASVADNDPSTVTTEYERQTAGPQANGFVMVGSSNTLGSFLGAGTQAESISTTAAGGAQGCNLQVDGKPCGFATSAQNGTISSLPNSSMVHWVTQDDVGTAILVDVRRSSTPVTTYTRRLGPTGTDPGKIRHEISWNLPEIRIGGLPSGMTAPNQWQGYYVRLRDFTATATAEAGTGTSAPIVAITGGTVDAWAGGGYTSYPVAANAVDGTSITINSLNQSSGSGGNQRRVDMTGTVTIGQATATSTVLSGTTRTEAEASIGSPFSVDLQYVITVGNSVQANLNLQFTAGTAAASVTYQPAATA